MVYRVLLSTEMEDLSFVLNILGDGRAITRIMGEDLLLEVRMEGENEMQNGIDGFSEFLDPAGAVEAEEESVVSESEMRAIPGYDVMPLIADSMAYELRIEMENGECDLDFPGRSEEGE